MQVSDKMKNPNELDGAFVGRKGAIANSPNEGLEPLSSVLSSRLTFCHNKRAVWRLYPEHICVMPAPPVNCRAIVRGCIVRNVEHRSDKIVKIHECVAMQGYSVGYLNRRAVW